MLKSPVNICLQGLFLPETSKVKGEDYSKLQSGKSWEKFTLASKSLQLETIRKSLLHFTALIFIPSHGALSPLPKRMQIADH